MPDHDNETPVEEETTTPVESVEPVEDDDETTESGPGGCVKC